MLNVGGSTARLQRAILKWIKKKMGPTLLKTSFRNLAGITYKRGLDEGFSFETVSFIVHDERASE